MSRHGLGEQLYVLIGKLGQWLRLRPAEMDRLMRLRARVTESLAANQDRLDVLKEEISSIEKRLLRLKGDLRSRPR